MPAKKLITYIQKVDGEGPRYEKPHDLEEFWVDARAGRYQCEIKRLGKPKSQDQLGAIFGLAIAQIIAEFNDLGMDTSYLIKTDKPTGIGVTTDLLKEYLYAVCPIYGDSGGRITLSKANTSQAAKFFDDIRNYASSQWGIVIPDPNPKWREELAK